MEEKPKKNYTKVKCKYCGNFIKKAESFANPDKPRVYYCNEECYNNFLERVSDKKDKK